MSVKAQAAGKRYTINNEWLIRYTEGGDDADRSRYVDVLEIKDRPANSQYLQDLIAMNIITTDDLTNEQRKASFFHNGVRIGDDDDGQDVDGVLEEETPRERTIQKYVGGINHPERFRRIYAWGTNARYISFCGYGINISSAGLA